jgi:hypothetical protein
MSRPSVLKDIGWQWLLLAIGLLICAGTFTFQQSVNPRQSSSTGQVSVTVYVKNSVARLLLRSFIFPNDPADDYLTFSVAGPKGHADPWLLVIQCTGVRKFHSKHQVMLRLENAPSGPGAGKVIVFSQPPGVQKKQWERPLGCFTQHTGANESAHATGLVVSTSSSCAGPGLRFGCFTAPPRKPGQWPGVAAGQTVNLTLPTLEADPAAQLTHVSTPVYAEEGAGGIIKDLVEVYQAPGAACPAPAPSQAPSPADTESPDPSGAVNSTPAISPPPTAPASSPNPSPSPGYGCYKPILKNIKPTMYRLPTSVETTETLENESLSGDRVDSMFPPGQIEPDDQIYWQGLAGLSPSLNATNLAAEARNSQYSFYAGILYGVGLSLIFAFVQIWLSALSRKKSNP